MSDKNSDTRSFKEAGGGQNKSKLVRSLALLSLLGGMQVATQYFAYQFNYQPQLGAHFNHLYPPWAIIEWGNQWIDHYPAS